MAQLKHIPNNSILARYSHDKVTPVNPTTCQNIDINHCKFTTVTVLMLNDVKQGYKIDTSSNIFGVLLNQ